MRMFYGQMQLLSDRYIPSAFIQWEHWMQRDNSPSSETKAAYVKMLDGQQPGWSLLQPPAWLIHKLGYSVGRWDRHSPNHHLLIRRDIIVKGFFSFLSLLS